MKLAIIGVGYVGLTSAAVFSDLGHTVYAVMRNEKKCADLKQGRIPIYEPGLEAVIQRNVQAGRLIPTLDYAEAVPEADVIFLCVGTPSLPSGEADLSQVEGAARTVAPLLKKYAVVVNKSTVPVGTGERVRKIIKEGVAADVEFDLASCPEFLREGTALEDTQKPDRIVIGTDSERAKNVLLAVHEKLPGERVLTNIKSAEMIKYASNAFLATKISFINEIANVCEQVGADVEAVAHGMGLDKRIGRAFLKAGLGWGGSCLTGSERVFLKDRRGNLYRLPIREAVDRFLKGDFTGGKLLSVDTKKQRLSYQTIVGATARFYKGMIIEVVTKMGRRLCLTEDHPCLVVGGETIRTVLARDLKTTDHFILTTAMPASRFCQSIDVLGAVFKSDSFDITQVKCRPLQHKLSSIPYIRVLLKKHFSKSKRYGGRHLDILRSNCLTVAEFLQIETALKPYIKRSDCVLFTTQGTTTYCPVSLPITPETARLIGYYISEGHVHYEKNGRARVQWTFNKKETEFIEDVRETLDQLGIKYDLRYAAQVAMITVSSRVFAYVIDQMLGCGKDSYTAKLPGFIYGAPKAIRRELLKGVFRGDGHFAFPRHSESVVLDFGTASKELANGMVELFQSLGFVASTKRSRSQKSKVWAHFLRLSGEQQVRQLLDFKDFKTAERARQRLQGYKKHISQTGFRRLNGELACVRLRSIKKYKRHLPVYSFEVAKTQTFVTSGGLAVHNCFPKDVRALHNIALTNDYDFKLLKAVIDVNNDQRYRLVAKARQALGGSLEGKEIAVLGLAFKPDTDDIRESAAISVVRLLLKEGARVRVYDPVATENARRELTGVVYAKDAYEAVSGAAAVLLVTEWAEFKNLDWARLRASMSQPVLVDGRNFLEPVLMRGQGWNYLSVGR